MQKRIECSVSGRVQMVMYRDFATRKARSLGLMGMVRNMPNGTVCVTAEGGEATLILFIEKLKKGSVLARVESVAVVWCERTGEFTDFHIVYK